MVLRVLRNPLFPALAALVLLAGCDGGGGDEPAEPVASVLGNGSRIREIQGEATWFDADDEDSLSCARPPDTTVHVTGVTVTAVDRFDEVADGALGNMYVQDTISTTGEYEGMTVFDPSFTPPDLRVARGDVLDLFGVYVEFMGPSSGPFGKCKSLPEIGGTGQFRFEGSNIAPLELELQELLGYEAARRYLGMLVTLKNVKILNDPVASNSTLPSGGRYTAELDRTGLDTTGVDPGDYVKISNELYDVLNQGPVMAKGSTFKSLTGVVTYFYGFKIAPRSPDDFVP